MRQKGIVCFALLIGSLMSGTALLPAPANDLLPTSAEVAASYTKYRQITKEPVQVNLLLAILCAGASQKQVEAARVKDGPHANASILIYMNGPAADAFVSKAKPYPIGSVVVKQKKMGGFRDEKGGYGVHGSASGVGGMIKRAAGYDPAHGDWEYFYFEDPAKIESGPIASCVQCHEGAKASDYVFGSWQHSGN